MFRLLLRFILRTLGIFAIAFGLSMAAFNYFDYAKEGIGFTIFMYVFLFVPVGGGYLCFLFAQDLYPRGTPHARSDALLQRFGFLLTFVYTLLIAISLPAKGRIVIAVLLLLIFARIHKPWSSRGAKTPFGYLSFANVFDFTIGGIFYVLTFVIFAVLTQGKVGGISFAGTGGRSGGGGASGRW